jgi:hypothetical protein
MPVLFGEKGVQIMDKFEPASADLVARKKLDEMLKLHKTKISTTEIVEWGVPHFLSDHKESR